MPFQKAEMSKETRDTPAEDTPQRTFTKAEVAEVVAEAMRQTQEETTAACKAQIDTQIAEIQAKIATEQEAFKATALEEAKDIIRREIVPFNIGGIAKQETKSEPGLKLGRMVRAVAVAKASGKQPIDVIHHWSKEGGSSIDNEIIKIMESQTNTLGGFLTIPAEVYGEVLPMLEAKSVVRSLQPETFTIPSGQLTFNKETSAGSASYVGETANIASTSFQFGQINLIAKKLAAIVPITNDLIRNSSPQVDRYVTSRLVTRTAIREDLAFIRGDGSQNTPKGLKNLIASANQFAQTSTTLDAITADALKAMRLVAQSDIGIERGAWIMHPRSEYYLMGLRDGNGNLVFAVEMAQGRWFNKPYRTSSQIPINLSSNQSEVYFCDFSKAILLDTGSIEVTMHENAAYHDGANVVSGVSTDTSVIRSISQHDFSLMYDLAGSVITGVTWGA